MIDLKNNSGITMIMMVITVVMMALIAVFSITNSRETVTETKIIKLYNEMREVKSAVLRYATTENLDNLSIYATTVFPAGSKYPASEQKLYYLDFYNDKNVLNDLLEVGNIEHDYVVNVYHLNDVEICLGNTVAIKGTTKNWTEQEILELYNDVFAGR